MSISQNLKLDGTFDIEPQAPDTISSTVSIKTIIMSHVCNAYLFLRKRRYLYCLCEKNTRVKEHKFQYFAVVDTAAKILILYDTAKIEVIFEYSVDAEVSMLIPTKNVSYRIHHIATWC